MLRFIMCCTFGHKPGTVVRMYETEFLGEGTTTRVLYSQRECMRCGETVTHEEASFTVQTPAQHPY